MSNKTSTIKENKEIMDLAYNLKETVAKENWISEYDTETDSFFLTVPHLPKDARLKYFGDEVAFYFDKKDEVKGIFIEYFEGNFVSHNKELKDLKKFLEEARKKSKDSDDVMIKVNKNKIQKAFNGLEEAMQMSLAKSIQIAPNTCGCK